MIIFIYTMEASPLHPAQTSFGLAPNYSELQAWLKLRTVDRRFGLHPQSSIERAS